MVARVHRTTERLGHLTLAHSVLDRRSELRVDDDLVPRLLSRPATRVLDIVGRRAPVTDDVRGTALSLRSPRDDDAGHLVAYLGDAPDGTAYLAVLDATETDREWADVRSLREVAPLMTDLDAGIFATALALANWHASHGHCPRCGTQTEPVRAGWTRVCPADGSEHFPRTDPAVIMSVVDEQDRLLLARSPSWPGQRYSVLAGFVEPGETLEAAVTREVHEEVGVDVTDATFLGDQPWPFPTSLMLGFTARALSVDLVLQDSEIAEAHWVTRAQLDGRLRSGEWAVSGRLSISRRLIEHWFGGELPDGA